MPLPKIETPVYETTLPSTKKLIEYRPFLVKEEKLLLIAQSSNDTREIIRTIKKMISLCTFEKVNPDEIAIYDLEYLFLQIRIKSVGETSDMKIKCEKCGKEEDVTIDLTQVEVVYPAEKVDNNIKLTDSIGVVMRSIPVKDVTQFSESANESEQLTNLISASIESIYDDNNVYSTSDVSREEVVEFIDSLSRSQIEKIENYIQNQPSLQYTVKFECTECGHHNEIELAGLQSFFS